MVFSSFDFAVFHVGEDIRSPHLDVLDGLRMDVDRQLLSAFPPFEDDVAVRIGDDVRSDPFTAGRQSIFVEGFDPRKSVPDRAGIGAATS